MGEEVALGIGQFKGTGGDPPPKIWCEHCRDRFNREHYDPDTHEHRVGKEFGPVGRSLYIEQVAREVVNSVEWNGINGWLSNVPTQNLNKLKEALDEST